MSSFLFDKKTRLDIPDGWHAIETIDMHTGGEPLRVITSGFPELEGNSVLEYRRFIRDNYDYLRTALMFEPRGHADMYGCILVPPNDADADFGIIFMHNEGYSTMCGHAIIAISKLAVQMNWVESSQDEIALKIDAPCGRIHSFVKMAGKEVESVRFHCVPSFVVGLDREVELPGYGMIRYDLAYGGAFYAYVDAGQLNLDLTPENYRKIIQLGMDIKHAVGHAPAQHPFEEDLSFLYGTIFIGDSPRADCHSRNVCVFAEAEVDRSPTGSGVSGRMAIHHARNELAPGQTLRIESITGSIFEGSVVEALDFGPYQAVIPQVSGTAYITGQHQFLIDPNDPMREGFILR
jgi:trans-L-3-hydroxyproline dehydratase